MATTPARDFAAEYLAARKQVRSSRDLVERGVAEATARRIAAAAARAGVRIDEIALDEQARRALYPHDPARPRVVGHHPLTHLPIYDDQPDQADRPHSAA
jgi:hypothetical protein